MKTEKMNLLCGIEAYGGNGSFEGQVHIVSEKYEALDSETKNKISYNGNKLLGVIRYQIEIEWAKTFEHAKRKAHVMELTQLFTDAGFEVVYVKEIDNQYSNDACYYAYPWVVVTTRGGPITLGWRKRVLKLDWAESDITADGRELFKDESTTKDERYVHCWGKDKAVEYLKKLLMEG